jgi:Zn-dependent protease
VREVAIFAHRLRLFSLFGFDVWIDASWLLLAALITWTLADAVFPAITPDLSVATYWWMAAAATIGLLFSIVLHETARSLVARHYGMPIRGITLFVFGGVAEMEKEPSSPKAELLMAAAGPISSLVLSAAFFALNVLAKAWNPPAAVEGMLWYLGFINGMLALFNLVPAFPLDGGRILRAALWIWRDDLPWATRIATGAGNLFGIALMALGVFRVVTGDFVGGMWQFLIGMFLRGAAAASYQEVIARNALKGISIARIMTRVPISVTPEVSIAAFINDFVYRHHHRMFPVTREGTLVGCVGIEQAATVDRAAWPVTAVGQIMVACGVDEIIGPDADALVALAQMRRAGRTRLWVVQQGRLIGVLSLRDMLDLLSVRLALGVGEPQAGRLSGRSGATRWR